VGPAGVGFVTMKIVARNRRARHNYTIEETYEAGIALTGSEVKSVRAGRVSLDEGYAKVEEGEVWLYGVHIAPYEASSYFGHEPERPRKLLLSRKEISRLVGKTTRAGYTLVPLSLYFNERGYAKVELALAKGRTKVDKRRKLIEEEEERRARQALRRFERGG